jgi:predicted solute-binding protein
MIGDKALRYRLEHPDEGIDLAQAWKEKTGLPFVFARLCAHPKHIKRIRRLSARFFNSPPKVPYSLLKKEAAAHGLTVSQLKNYLDKIHYRLGWREKRALRLFSLEECCLQTSLPTQEEQAWATFWRPNIPHAHSSFQYLEDQLIAEKLRLVRSK